MKNNNSSLPGLLYSLLKMVYVMQKFEQPIPTEEVGHDINIGLTQYHMTLEYSLEQFRGVAFLVTGAQLAMAIIKSALFCLTRVVADNVLECFAKVKAEIAMSQRIAACPLS